MDEWVDFFSARCMSLKITLELIKKYVDGVCVLARNLPLGTRYDGQNLNWSRYLEKEDLDAGVRAEDLTMNILQVIASDILPSHDFTAEVSHGVSDPVACLDTQLWVGTARVKDPWFSGGVASDQEIPGQTWTGPREKSTVLYKFFKKKMANPITILQRSAMQESFMRATFSSEVIRRLKTSSTGLATEEVEEVLEDFMGEMVAMG